LGFTYENGDFHNGMVEDMKLAAKYYREAAEAGDPKGQMNLGRLYFEGSGVDKDQVEAYKWFYIANLSGEGTANHYLQQLRGNDPLHNQGLAPAQIKEAELRAREWKKSHDQLKPNQQ